MKKILALTLSSLLLITPIVSAHPGAKDKNGGHTCKTNCEKYELNYGEYHLHNPDGTAKRVNSTQTTTSKPTSQQKSTPSKPSYQHADVTVLLDNKKLSFEQSPVIINNRTLVPLRTIFEALGATISWDGTTKTVTATKDSDVIKLAVGNNTAYKNNQSVEIDAVPVIVNGTTMVPARFVATALGALVGWNAATKTITINTIANELSTNVIKVIDGDTIKVMVNDKEENIRMIGVDTPETVHPNKPVQPYGKEASDYTKSRLEGQNVRLELDVQERDQYGRLLAYVWLGDEMINKTLVAEGYARVATFPPNVKYVDEFTRLQEKAREASKGLWSLSVE